MKALKLVYIVLILCVCEVLSQSIKPPKESYKILMLLPVASGSHRNIYTPLAHGLAERGHQVVILSGLPNKFNHENITEINHGVDTMHTGSMNMFKEMDGGPSEMLKRFKTILPKAARDLYQVGEVKTLYERRDEFDVMIVNGIFNEVAYPFLHEKPFIIMSLAGHNPVVSATQGNIMNPAYVPGMFDFPRPFSLFHRALNLLLFIVGPIIWRNVYVLPDVQVEIDKVFPNLPSLVEIERNASMVFINTHFSIDIPLPLLPSEIEMGFTHCHPPSALPENLKQWIDGSGEDGVIYFSLGSIAKGETMPDHFKQVFIEAFSKLKQRVIWKYENEIQGLSSNVMISKWLPQQDILGNPNVKLFITHGGLFSTQEAIYHSTPLIALPIFGDQPRNAAKIALNGFGLSIDWNKLTVDTLITSIEEIINNPKYTKKLQSVSSLIADQPLKPIDNAIWWTEYVARNKGGPNRSPATSISWIEYFMLDVIFACHIVVYIIYYIIKKIVIHFISTQKRGKVKTN